jgi:hypothetical protein
MCTLDLYPRMRDRIIDNLVDISYDEFKGNSRTFVHIGMIVIWKTGWVEERSFRRHFLDF